MNTILSAIGVITGLVLGLTGGSGMSVMISSLLVIGINTREVIALTFVITLINSAMALPAFIRKKHIAMKDTLRVSLPAISFVFLGFHIQRFIPITTLTWLMILILSLIGYHFLFKPSTTKTSLINISEQYRSIALIIAGSVMGLVMGIMGGGGGVIISIILMLLFNYPVHKAIGTAIFIMALTSIPGTYLHTMDGTMPWDIFPYIVVPSMITSFFASYVGASANPKIIKKGLGLYLLVICILLIIKTSMPLLSTLSS